MKRIVVCDDEPHIVEGLRHLLRGANRQIVTTSCGREALERVAEAPTELLVVDIMMPGLSGLEVVAALREQEKTRSLPIIILTAKGQAQDAGLIQEVWGATVMGKPFEPDRLRELVNGILEAEPCLVREST
jgi:CheY-like chemotaxis protein